MRAWTYRELAACRARSAFLRSVGSVLRFLPVDALGALHDAGAVVSLPPGLEAAFLDAADLAVALLQAHGGARG